MRLGRSALSGGRWNLCWYRLYLYSYSIVERVLLHMVEPPPLEPSECLRVFVVFSGMAGAWRATKELDGRFFGGKKIVSLFSTLHCIANKTHVEGNIL